MTRFKILLIGTSLSFIPLTVNAQCVATQDCATLGYTETSCNGEKGVKCPFGNKWACLPTEAEICKKNGFTESCTGAGQSGSGKSCGGIYAECSCDSSYQYSCSGTGYAGGAGTACGGKYTSCTCASGYEWKEGTCKQKITDGAHDNLYYCNGKVVGVKTSDMDFYIAINEAGHTSCDKARDTSQNYSFCGKTGELPNTKKLQTIYKNKSKLNNLLLQNGGTKLAENYYWSSDGRGYSEGYGNYSDIINMSTGSILTYGGSYNAAYVRPILSNY